MVRRFALVATTLVVLWGLLGVAQWVWTAQQDKQVEGWQDDAVTEAFTHIETDWTAFQTDLLAEARRLAEAPIVIHGLREHQRGRPLSELSELVTFFSQLPLPLRVAVEVYDPVPQRVVWQGYSLPLDEGPSRTRFLETFQTEVVVDGDVRQALVVWWPVRDGLRVLGAVRVMQLLSFTVPVRNQYLSDYSLAEVWSRQTGLDVSVVWGSGQRQDASVNAGQIRLLQGADGQMLGQVFVQPPAREDLFRTRAIRFGHVQALVLLLLIIWLLIGSWTWFRQGYSHLESSPLAAGIRHVVLRFVVFVGSMVVGRYLMLMLDVPARWQQNKTPLAPLFDPRHLASALGGGALRTIGDLLVTALFAVLIAIACIQMIFRIQQWLQRPVRNAERASSSALVFLATAAGAGLLLVGLVGVLASITRHAILDSTLDYFSHTGLLPERLVTLVFIALVLLALSVLLLLMASGWATGRVLWQTWPRSWSLQQTLWMGGGALVIPVVVLYLTTNIASYIPWMAVVLYGGASIGLVWAGWVWKGPLRHLYTLRVVLPMVFILTILIYPMLFSGMDARQRVRMMDAAAYFADEHDPWILFAINDVFKEIQKDDTIGSYLAQAAPGTNKREQIDQVAAQLMRGSLLASLASHEVSLTFFDTQGVPTGRYFDAEQSVGQGVLDQDDQLEYDLLRAMHREAGKVGAIIEQITGRRESERFQYSGLLPLYTASGDVLGWAMARAEPEVYTSNGNTPFPQVLTPSGIYRTLYTDLSLAEFRDGVIVRSFGRNFGRYRLDTRVAQQLTTEASIWRREQVDEGDYLTFYQRRSQRVVSGNSVSTGMQRRVLAVRISAIKAFDHLYYILRLTVSGLFVALPLYCIGLVLRWRAGLLPAPKVQFRDKVLNAFFAVGIIAVGAMGFVGMEVVTGENERAIQHWLKQHLERVETTLSLDARGGELPYRVLDRTNVDSLAARVGLDLNIYRGTQLVASSRPQLTRDRLIDERLPIQAYNAFYIEGYRFVYVDEQIGDFRYTAGYRALPDEEGNPRFIVSVPTLPEQERIEEERARTLAYLFGALLLLVVMLMLTASLLANALARPIGQLQAGLESVAQGRFERIQPLDTRDEIGELVQSFNEMQTQLVESRRKLTQQERQLAWREMARQVAHEIKNPLTPMKLSIQHLRRAFDDHATAPQQPSSRFDRLFERVTSTLIEQIDALTRIANEFSTFARMPRRVLEVLDLNEVVQEAVALMQEEEGAAFVLDLSEQPLMLRADREELRRIYINLIKNGIQAIPDGRAGSVTVRTRLKSREEHSYIYSTVTDNGTGIPEALHDKIFVPNFSTKTSGTGLGLAITKKSIEDLHGEVGFETQEGTGTTFWIRLPVESDEALRNP